MHITMPPQAHTPSTTSASDDCHGTPAISGSGTGTESSRAMANPYAVALNGLADVYRDRAWMMRSQEVDPRDPNNPKVSLAPADIRFLAHCGVTMDGQPIEQYINDKGNLLTPLELERLSDEMRKRAAAIELEPGPTMVGGTAMAAVQGRMI